MIRSAVSSASSRTAAMPSKVGSTTRSSLTPRRFTGVRRRRPGAGVRRVRSRHRTAHRQMPDDGISRIPAPGPAPPEFRARRCRSACGRSPSHAHNRHSDRAADRRIQARKAHREKRSPLFHHSNRRSVRIRGRAGTPGNRNRQTGQTSPRNTQCSIKKRIHWSDFGSFASAASSISPIPAMPSRSPYSRFHPPYSTPCHAP